MPLAAYVAAQSDLNAAIAISVVLACASYAALLVAGALTRTSRFTF
jgi:hypothetical protein